jgi:2-polyprenyl-3-methyl-5-hydroxy-6-metoxy-1,4-benzoquinol methylase
VKPPASVAADFDRIALALAAERAEWPLSPAERFVLRQIPAHARRALDVGCGDGRLTRAIAARGLTVLGVDVSPAMIGLARRRAGADPRLAFRVADVLTDAVPCGGFDLVVSVATVHHMPLDAVVPRLVAALAPGGTLVIQDLTTRRGWRGLPMNALAWCVRQTRRVRQGRAPSPRVAALYEAHGTDEAYLPASRVASVYRRLLDGARVSLHLEWRYTVVWRRAA